MHSMFMKTFTDIHELFVNVCEHLKISLTKSEHIKKTKFLKLTISRVLQSKYGIMFIKPS